MIAPDDARDLTEALSRLMDTAERFGRGSTSSVRVDAGGAGVWAATTACLIMLAVALVGGWWVSDRFAGLDDTIEKLERDNEAKIDKLERKSETQEAYLQAIYQIAPQFKPKDEAEGKDS